MSYLSNKCLYALQAVLELSSQHATSQSKGVANSRETMSISEIASRRGIPVRFLEAILRELKDAGIAVSVRGKEGGYKLEKDPAELKVGDIVRVFSTQEGKLDKDSCVFKNMVAEATKAFFGSLDKKTFQELATAESREKKVINFSI